MQPATADSRHPGIETLKLREQEILLRLRADPLSIPDYGVLAEIEIQLGDQPRALLAINEAARLSPADPALAIRAAHLHNMRADWHRAALEYERALRLGLRDARLVAALLLAQLAGRSMSAAHRCAARLLREFPDEAAAWLGIGALRKATGDLPGASKAYRRAVELDESLGAGWYGLIELATPEEREACRPRIKRLLTAASTPYERSNLEFALARIAAEARDYAGAFDSYARANEAAATHLETVGLTYQPASAQTEISVLASAQQYSRPAQPFEPVRVTPIFIVGMPRSGSTLIEQMLSNHPRVGSTGETTALSEAYEQYSGTQHRNADEENALLTQLRQQYVGRLREQDQPHRFVTDKFPGNFRLLGFAKRLFPEAPVLHCRRDPMATCWSIFTTNLTLHAPYHTSLGHIGHFYTQYFRLMAHWRESLPLLQVDYERLIEGPAAVIQEILSYCGLEYSERCLRPQDNRDPVTTASAAQVRQPLYRSALQQWRHYEPWLQPLRTALSVD
ncbi:MAG TPA: sulfotransferase [Steroidobacteraceae bacterium]|nr:sulfotransferase [Steroidobacteraceae bacterium]